ncbi:MAG: methyltransferase domain-containing protein [Candidatus Acidiferrales bacterium]
MEIDGWDKRYRSRERPKEDLEASPNPLLVETVGRMRPGKALDLACGAGRNAIWLAQQDWTVTAFDGAASAIEILQNRAAHLGVAVDARVVDLAQGVYRIEESSWDLIAICYYLQRSLFEPAKRGVKPGGILLAIVHVGEPGHEPTEHQSKPGELHEHFLGWEILHYREGGPRDIAHQRSVAEIVAQRPSSANIAVKRKIGG